MSQDKQNEYQYQFQGKNQYNQKNMKQKRKNMRARKLNMMCDSKLKRNLFFENQNNQIEDYNTFKIIHKKTQQIINLQKSCLDPPKLQRLNENINLQNTQQQLNENKSIQGLQQKGQQKVSNSIQFDQLETSQKNSRHRHLIKQEKIENDQHHNNLKFVVQDFDDIQPLESSFNLNVFENIQTKKKILVDDFGDYDEQDNTIKQNAQRFQTINIIDSIPKNKTMKQFLSEPIPKGFILQCAIKRTSSVYHLYISKTYHYLMSAKKRNCSTSSSYIYSLDKNIFEKDNDLYIGKLRSNFFGTLFNAFDNGVNPKQKNKSNRVRANILSVEYQTNILGLNGPRKMKVYIPNLNQKEQMIQIRPDTEQQNLTSEKNRHLVKNFINKPPKWNSSLSAYVLNFHGRANMSSVKNFLIVQQGKDKEYLLFGRVGQDVFNLDIQYPFSVLQGFSLVLSSFDRKFGCE